MARIQGTRSSNFTRKGKSSKAVNVFLQICKNNSKFREIMNVANSLTLKGYKKTTTNIIHIRHQHYRYCERIFADNIMENQEKI